MNLVSILSGSSFYWSPFIHNGWVYVEAMNPNAFPWAKANLGLWHAWILVHDWSNPLYQPQDLYMMKSRPNFPTTHEVISYFRPLNTKFDTTRVKRIELDQNANPICFLEAMSELPPFLPQVNISCELASKNMMLVVSLDVEMSGRHGADMLKFEYSTFNIGIIIEQYIKQT